MDCVSSIIDFYNSKLNDKQIDSRKFSRVYLSTILIKIMNGFTEGKTDDLELKNCLILLVNLFTDLESPDHYNDKGRNAKEIVNDDKVEYKEILKREFLNN